MVFIGTLLYHCNTLRNDRRNANRNHELWEDFSQLVEIEKLKFIFILIFHGKGCSFKKKICVQLR